MTTGSPIRSNSLPKTRLAIASVAIATAKKSGIQCSVTDAVFEKWYEISSKLTKPAAMHAPPAIYNQ